jgi:prepilin peptidase CpaA
VEEAGRANGVFGLCVAAGSSRTTDDMGTREIITLTAVILTAGTAALVDLKTRRIPNVIPATAALAGILLGALGASDTSLPSAGLGLAVGALLLLPGYVYGGTGAGDVKLLASQGAILGAGRVVAAFLFGAIAGGVIAIALAIQRRELRQTVGGTFALVTAPAAGRQRAFARTTNRIPYGPAIAIGSALAAVSGL